MRQSDPSSAARLKSIEGVEVDDESKRTGVNDEGGQLEITVNADGSHGKGPLSTTTYLPTNDDDNSTASDPETAEDQDGFAFPPSPKSTPFPSEKNKVDEQGQDKDSQPPQ